MEKQGKKNGVKTKLKQNRAEKIKLALQKISEGMSVRKASTEFGIPRTTLQDKKLGRHVKPAGAPTVLTPEEEQVFANWIIDLGKHGFPVTKDQLLYSVEKYVTDNGKKGRFKNGTPRRRWYKGFLNLHEEISKRVPQNLTQARTSINEEGIRNWHAKVEQFFVDHDLGAVLNCPDRIFNCDETAFYLNPKDKYILARKGAKQIYSRIFNDEKECLTVLVGASADGKLLPPLTLFPYKRMPQNIAAKMPKNWAIGRTDSGWMTCESFFEYITNVFFPYLEQNNIERPVVMFLDGHSSHFSLHLSNFCSEKGIVLIGLIPNATHLLQPMDVALFHPLKNEWKKTVREWRINSNNGERLKREDFSRLVDECLKKAAKPNTINNGFKTCGLYPFDVNAIPFDKLLTTTNPFTETTQEDGVEQIKKNDVSEDPRSLLTVIESTIGCEKVEIFKSCENDGWNGPVQDEGLFHFWLEIKKKIPESTVLEDITNMTTTSNHGEHSRTLEANINFSTSLELDENLFLNGNILDLDVDADGIVALSTPKLTENTALQPRDILTIDAEQLLDTLDENVPQQKNMPIINAPQQHDTPNINDALQHNSPIPKAPQQRPSTSREPMNTSAKKIPTPFKNALFWPDIPTSSAKKNVKKRITPSVAIADQFVEYQKRAQKEKDAKLLKTKAKDKGKKKLVKTKDDANDDEEINKENATSVALNSTEISKNDFVVITYEEEKFPGLVIEIKKGPKFRIKAMALAGMGKRNRWKWPEKEDVLDYERDDIAKKYAPPILINSRGIYAVNVN